MNREIRDQHLLKLPDGEGRECLKKKNGQKVAQFDEKH